MPISPLSATGGTSSPAATQVEQQPAIGRDAFMKMLVAQLRNQDPLDPMDSREFVTQLSQLSSVEELINIRSNISMLSLGIGGIANTQAADLVGRTVTADVRTLRLGDNGTANGVYTLGARTSEATLTIRDASGQAVRTMELGALSPGSHAFTWDGAMDDGSRAASGQYRVEINAKDASGNPIEASSRITGIVSSISYSGGFPELRIGEAQVALGDISSIDS